MRLLMVLAQMSLRHPAFPLGEIATVLEARPKMMTDQQHCEHDP